MYRYIFLISACIVSNIVSFASSASALSPDVILTTNCAGTQIIRTSVGVIQVRHIEKNTPGCTGSRSPESSQRVTDDDHAPISNPQEITNCNGTRVTHMDNGTPVIVRVSRDLPGCIRTTETHTQPDRPVFDPQDGPAFDIRSTDIVNYRTMNMSQDGIRYAHVTRSVKMRGSPTMQSRVNAYLIKNDAVVISGRETGWVQSQWADIIVTDTGSNTIIAHTGAQATGYVAAKYLRTPNASDLVRIGQADQAYWSDLVHVNVPKVNLRAHPWYGAKIFAVLTNKTRLYTISTVDNWSEVISDDRTIHGFIRTDYLTVDQAQRVDR